MLGPARVRGRELIVERSHECSKKQLCATTNPPLTPHPPLHISQRTQYRSYKSDSRVNFHWRQPRQKFPCTSKLLSFNKSSIGGENGGGDGRGLSRVQVLTPHTFREMSVATFTKLLLSYTTTSTSLCSPQSTQAFRLEKVGRKREAVTP